MGASSVVCTSSVRIFLLRLDFAHGFEISAGASVTSKKTLNAKNLEALGAERLAELLMEISRGNAAAKRRLRLELAGAQSPSEVAKEVRKRLTSIARSRSSVDWQTGEHWSKISKRSVAPLSAKWQKPILPKRSN